MKKEDTSSLDLEDSEKKVLLLSSSTLYNLYVEPNHTKIRVIHAMLQEILHCPWSF